MKRSWCHIALLLTAALTGEAALAATGLSSLRCEQLADPEGIDVSRPRLSWVLEGDTQGLEQTGYQILVASSPQLLAAGKGDYWATGKVRSGQSLMIEYRGKPLESRMDCYWKVRVWTTAGETGWSATANWSMGLLRPEDWKGKWIGYDQGFPWDSIGKFSRLSARYFRKEFGIAAAHSGRNASSVAGPSGRGGILKATLYVAGLGHYIALINGEKVGDEVLAEAPTDYTQAVKYNSYDVTSLCRPGANAIGVVLGNGRYFTMRQKYKPKKIKEFGFPRLLLQLEIVTDDGRRQLIGSDTSWSFTADGPIRSNNEYDGEEYDARKELGRWADTGYDRHDWLRARLVSPPGGRLEAQMNEPIKVMATLKPAGISEWRPGVWIVDMGQNMAGWLRMKVHGPAGQQVRLRFGERLTADGALYTANLRDARATDIYILKGEGEEVWHPVFVYHGFRFAEITGYPGRPAAEDFEGEVVYDDLPTIGEIRTSSGLLDSIIRNAWWGIASNYKGMPVDCPQRNERMPWLGDRTTGALGESYFFGNENLYAKWLDDIAESQKADGALPDVAPAYWNYYSDNMTWPGAYITIAEMLYRQFADVRPIQRHYDSMKKWLRYMADRYERDGIMTRDKYGDWCVPPESPALIHTRDPDRITDGRLIATAYYYYLAGLMAGFARILHRDADEKYFLTVQEKTKTAFRRVFRDHNGSGYSNNTPTANLLPLCFGMVPDSDKSRVLEQIVDKIDAAGGHLGTGVIGTQWLMRGLTRNGRADLAVNIATNRTYPGWGYMVAHGATTIWELWNGDSASPAMNSGNHVMLLGDLLTWCWQDLAGIAPGSPGFKVILM